MINCSMKNRMGTFYTTGRGSGKPGALTRKLVADYLP